MLYRRQLETGGIFLHAQRLPESRRTSGKNLVKLLSDPRVVTAELRGTASRVAKEEEDGCRAVHWWFATSSARVAAALEAVSETLVTDQLSDSLPSRIRRGLDEHEAQEAAGELEEQQASQKAEARRKGRIGEDAEVAYLLPAAQDVLEEMEGDMMCRRMLAGEGEYPIDDETEAHQDGQDVEYAVGMDIEPLELAAMQGKTEAYEAAEIRIKAITEEDCDPSVWKATDDVKGGKELDFQKVRAARQ